MKQRIEQIAPDQWQELAQQLLRVRRPVQAEEIVRRQLSQQPRDAFAYVLLGVALLHQDRFPAAQAAAQQSIALYPQAGEAHYLLSLIFCQKDKLRDALRALTEALRLDPNNAEYLGRQAWLLNSCRQTDEALQAARRGLTLDPTHTQCLAQQIYALRQFGRIREAQAVTHRLLQTHPTLPTAHLLSGEAALERREFDEAEARFREVLRLEPDNTWAKDKLLAVLLCVAEAARHRGETTRTQAYFLEIWQLDPGNAVAYPALVAPIKNTFGSNRLLHRFGTHLHQLRQQKSAVLVPLVLLAVLFCVPIGLLVTYAAIRWRFHPEARALRRTVRRRRALKLVVPRVLLAWLLLTVLLGFCTWFWLDLIFLLPASLISLGALNEWVIPKLELKKTSSPTSR